MKWGPHQEWHYVAPCRMAALLICCFLEEIYRKGMWLSHLEVGMMVWDPVDWEAGPRTARKLSGIMGGEDRLQCPGDWL